MRVLLGLNLLKCLERQFQYYTIQTSAVCVNCRRTSSFRTKTDIDDTEQPAGTPQPGMVISPQITLNTAKRLVTELYNLNVTSIKELNSYVDKNYHVNVMPVTRNSHIQKVCDSGYVLKILNTLDTQKEHVVAETEMVKVVSDAGIKCPIPELDVYGSECSIQRLPIEKHSNSRTTQTKQETGGFSIHLVRLMKFIPGERLVDIQYDENILYQIGQLAGRTDKALQGFSHPGITSYDTMWSLAFVPRLTEYLHAVRNRQHRECCQQIIQQFNSEIVPNYQKFQTGVIHGDFNDHNIIVSKQDDDRNQYEVAGIIDFGDSTDSYIVFEIAIAIMYLMVESEIVDIMDVGGHVLRGYYEHITLNEAEKQGLVTLVLGRYCQSLVLGAYSYLQDPGNEYLLCSADKGWKQLVELWNIPKHELYANWQKVTDS